MIQPTSDGSVTVESETPLAKATEGLREELRRTKLGPGLFTPSIISGVIGNGGRVYIDQYRRGGQERDGLWKTKASQSKSRSLVGSLEATPDGHARFVGRVPRQRLGRWCLRRNQPAFLVVSVVAVVGVCLWKAFPEDNELLALPAVLPAVIAWHAFMSRHDAWTLTSFVADAIGGRVVAFPKDERRLRPQRATKASIQEPTTNAPIQQRATKAPIQQRATKAPIQEPGTKSPIQEPLAEPEPERALPPTWPDPGW